MSQSKKMSAIEIAVDMAFGFALATSASYWILPLWGLRPNVGEAMQITVMFTVISIIRRYISRRFFNWLHTKGVN